MAAGADTTQENVKNQTFLRVSSDKISRLMDLVGELSLSVSETVNCPDLDGLELESFDAAVYRLSSIVRGCRTPPPNCGW